MRWPRKGIVIRLLIYIPIIGYLGYQAAQKWSAEHGETESDAPTATDLDERLQPYKRVIEMPDGSKQEIVELTEEQAEQLLGRPVPDPASDAKQAAEPAPSPN